jgi:CTP synthase
VKINKTLHGILVAPGFGERGIEGKITALNMHGKTKSHSSEFVWSWQACAVIEFARNVLGYKDAHSTEMNPETSHPVIDLMEEQKQICISGGTMRLGAYPCELKEDSK